MALIQSRPGAATRCAMGCDRPKLAACCPGSGLGWPGAGRCSASITAYFCRWALVFICCCTGRRGAGCVNRALIWRCRGDCSVFSPVIVWNATHGWASFLFQGGRAVGGATFRPGPYAAGACGPGDVFVSVDLGALDFDPVQRLLYWRRLRRQDRLLLSLAVVPLAVFTVVACFRPVLPHWGLIGLVSLFPALGAEMVDALRDPAARDSTASWHAAVFFR